VLTKEIVDFQPDIAVFQRQIYLNVEANVCVPYVATILTNMQNCCKSAAVIFIVNKKIKILLV
jgi:hypothetical protein